MIARPTAPFVCSFTLALAALAGCSSASSTNEEVGTSEGAVTSVCGGSRFVRGVDVSAWQGTMNWAAIKDQGNVFAYTRIGDGLYEDPTFQRNWAGIAANGMLRGAYQYFEPATDPVAQADIVVRKVGKLAEYDLPVMLDIETTNGMGGDAIAISMGSGSRASRQAPARSPSSTRAGTSGRRTSPARGSVAIRCGRRTTA